MSEQISTVRNVSDTARWVAYFRAMETKRPDALFRDPFAERLAGEHGFQIANSLVDGNNNEWGWVARTYLFDEFATLQIGEGADLVVNLAAGLDARPYRMDLPAQLRWIEVDLPEIITYKETILAGEEPKCHLERVALDLADIDSRRDLFAKLDYEAKRIVVITEGLLLYFSPEEVAAFAKDLARGPKFNSWIIDLVSPGQLKQMQRSTGKQLSEVGAAFKFGPAEGPDFFVPLGWESVDVQGLLRTAYRFKRSPAGLIPLAAERERAPGNFPWAGVCLLKRRFDETGSQCAPLSKG